MFTKILCVVLLGLAVVQTAPSSTAPGTAPSSTVPEVASGLTISKPGEALTTGNATNSELLVKPAPGDDQHTDVAEGRASSFGTFAKWGITILKMLLNPTTIPLTIVRLILGLLGLNFL